MKRIQKPDFEKVNPCQKEQEMTYKCMNDNNFIRDKCLDYMENYKTCKKFWGRVQAYRRREGLRPILPEVADREEVKKDFLKNHYFT
ncbi:PREDICTED: coiled-coil-helix-coiled-coil-helix domain-containing protein 7 [Nicrophorus vespilloides]|uniref:Coiled-coil-helix-coiled-coil-helix domain-containing protein 7 n=1 Tax=Nicrophorus vespilloides TaxID=110193 RepID=A0ABM1M7M2_NICVS|nr:PREDICTED: coiled-coil-helix-coiled-coil-helix domain-containing protein 7 [Nicrophorus vespilloides]